MLRLRMPQAVPQCQAETSRVGLPVDGRASLHHKHEAPSRFSRGGLTTSRRRYFFFAAFILPDPQEDLLLFVVFFDMHAIAVPPLRK